MCGINGIAFPLNSGKHIDEKRLIQMRDVLSHRGPDGAGLFVEASIGLGHRRLSIVDVAHGAQPMHSADGRFVIVYNGEVYNHLDERRRLEQLGHSFETRCDTETILHLYQEHGPDCVNHLRGMFAFAIWDRAERTLFLARDRFGVKPLYYVHRSDGSFYFASEVKSLLSAGAVTPRLHYEALPDQLANHGTTAEDTLFEGVKRLAPGHTLEWKNGKLSTRKYWDLCYEPKTHLSDRDAVEHWLSLFRESVKLRLMADVPLGMFLSGGIDSSAIAAVMAELVDEPIRTFSVGFAEDEANEFRYARLVAKRFETDHHEITITPDEFFAKVPDLVWHEDEPLGFLASVPLYFVSCLAQQHVKVVLTGEGSDEMLAGYGRYSKALRLLSLGQSYEAVTPQVVRGAIQAGVGTLPRGISRRLDRTFLSRSADVESLFFDNFAVFPAAMQRRLFSRATQERCAGSDPFKNLNRILADADAEELLDKLLYSDTRTYLHELLMKQDQMSMAASIESRVPFLDHKLAEFSARLPTTMKLQGNTTKWVLREAMRGILPDEILTRSKMGFPVPLGKWLRGPFKWVIDEYVLSPRALERGIFDPAFVRSLVAEHLAGIDHDERLWALINFEIWHRRFIDGEVPA